MSDFAFRVIGDLKNYQSEIAKIPGMTDKTAADAAAKLVFRLEKGGRTAGQRAGAAVVDGMEGAVAAGRVNLLNQVADIAVQAQMGMSPATIALQQGPQVATALATMGSAAATAGAVLVGLGVTVAAGAAGWRLFTAETREAAAAAEDMRIAGGDLRPMLDSLRTAQLDLAVATGELSPLMGDLERSARATYRAYSESTADTAARVAELRREQESLTSQVRDTGRAFYEAIDPTGLLVEGYDRLWGSTDELGRRVEALRGQQEQQIDVLGRTVDANEQVIVAQNNAKLAADRRRKAEQELREEMEREWRLMQASQADQAAEINRQDAITSALVNLRSEARATYIARLDGEEAIVAQLGEDMAAITATEATERQRARYAVEDQSIVAAANELRVERVALAEQNLAEWRAQEAEKERQRNERAAKEEAARVAQLEAARVAVVTSSLSAVTSLTADAYNRQASMARELNQELTQRAGDLTRVEEQQLQRRIDGHRRAALALFIASKGGAMAQAVVNTELAISNALASAPPPANALLAVAAGIAGAAQVAQIAASPPPTFHRGTLGAASQRRSEMLALVEPGEAVVQKYAARRPENQDALARMNGDRGVSGPDVLVIDRYDGRAFARSIRDQVRRPGPLRSALTAATPHYGHR